MESRSLVRLENMKSAQQAHRICACHLSRLPLLKRHWLSAPITFWFESSHPNSVSDPSTTLSSDLSQKCRRMISTMHGESLRHQESIPDLFSGVYPI